MKRLPKKPRPGNQACEKGRASIPNLLDKVNQKDRVANAKFRKKVTPFIVRAITTWHRVFRFRGASTESNAAWKKVHHWLESFASGTEAHRSGGSVNLKGIVIAAM